MEVIVIDNNSTDGSHAYLEPLFPQVKFCWGQKNIGFSKACNQGLRLAKGSFVLFLNPDTIVPEDCFEKCLRFFETHTDAGAIGVKMIDGSGKFLKESKRGFPSAPTSFFKLTGLTAMFPRSAFFARYYLGHLDEHSNHIVDVLSGAFMMIRKDVLDITGGFDERYFMYGEDIDLSYTIQKAGYRNYYYADTTIIHFKGESTRKLSLRYIMLFYKAMMIFVQKHYGRGSALLYTCFIQVAIIFRAGVAAITNSISSLLKIKSSNPGKYQHIYLAGYATECNNARLVLQKAGLEEDIIHDIIIEGNENHVHTLLQADAVLKNNRLHKIVFCEGKLLFTVIIFLMQKLPSGVEAMIYADKSNCIVGSVSKNGEGDTIPEE